MFADAVWLTRDGGRVVNVGFVIVYDAAERGGRYLPDNRHTPLPRS